MDSGIVQEVYDSLREDTSEEANYYFRDLTCFEWKKEPTDVDNVSERLLLYIMRGFILFHVLNIPDGEYLWL